MRWKLTMSRRVEWFLPRGGGSGDALWVFFSPIFQRSLKGGKIKLVDFFFIGISATQIFAMSRIFRYGLPILSKGQKKGDERVNFHLANSQWLFLLWAQNALTIRDTIFFSYLDLPCCHSDQFGLWSIMVTSGVKKMYIFKVCKNQCN